MLHVITTIARGGAENQLLVLTREQVRSGRKVAVAPLKGEPELKAELESNGVEVITSLLNKGPLTQIVILRKLIKCSDYLVHAHLPRAELISAVGVDSKRFVFSRHNSEPFFPGTPRLLSNSLSRLVAYRAKSGIAISLAVKNYVIQRGEISKSYPLKTILYGANPVNESLANEITRESLGIPANSFVIGTVSRLTPQKDLLTLIKVFELFLKDAPEAILIIIGEGQQKKELLEFADKRNVSSRIHWLGRRNGVRNYIKLFDVFALTSLYEGFGLVLLEAMQSEVPIVASANSAIPEVLGFEYPGLCKTGSEKDFLEKIIALRNSDYRKKILGIQARRLGLFNAEIMCKLVDEVYQ